MTEDGSGRRAHAALMDDVYRHQRHVYDLSRRYFLLGRDHALRQVARPGECHVLELGCGTARNLISLVGRHPGMRAYGLDASEQMLSTARAAVARARLADRVRMAVGDARAFDATELFGRGQFDRVLLSYMVSMVPGWEGVLDRAMRLLAPDGLLVIVDFGDAPRLPRWFRAALRAWLARFHVEPRSALWECFQAAAAVHGLSDLQRSEVGRGYAVLLSARRPAATHPGGVAKSPSGEAVPG